ncbi:MAG TPA: hypothetical protein VHJ38_09665, partial [Nitrososphaeraceae archaeon]|nr:hypothetical protein [Nitrososphaeraceae archaeon]
MLNNSIVITSCQTIRSICYLKTVKSIVMDDKTKESFVSIKIANLNIYRISFTSLIKILFVCLITIDRI